VALFLCFFLYKNIALIMLDVIWMVQFRFKGMVAVPEYLSINYNAFFTSLHILPLLALDKDIPDEHANNYPELYHVGPARQLFNMRVFTKWVLIGVMHGAVCWLVPYSLISPEIEDISKEDPSEFWVTSVTAFTSVIFVVCLKLIVVSQNPGDLHSWLPTLAAFLIYFCVLFGISYSKLGNTLQPNMEGLPKLIAQETLAPAAVVIATIVALFPDVIGVAVGKIFCPSAIERVHRVTRTITDSIPLEALVEKEEIVAPVPMATKGAMDGKTNSSSLERKAPGDEEKPPSTWEVHAE
jgi:magnesium-transporting ATPase (P-type)